MPNDPIPVEDSLEAPRDVRALAAELLPLLYDDVRRLARRERRRVSAGGTMQTTALVHEAYLKLQGAARFNDREHFLRAAALAMRHVLVNHARERLALKRGAGVGALSVEDAPEIAAADDRALIEISEALARLAQLSPRLAQVVECRFFGGYQENETALALGLTDRTVRRDWVKARAWLRRELGRGSLGADDA